MKKLFLLISVLTIGSIAVFSQDIVPFKDKQTKKWGFKNRNTDSILVPARYDNTLEFSEGKGIVENNKKLGVVNEAGEEIIPCKFDNLWFNRESEEDHFGELASYSKDFYTRFNWFYFVTDQGVCKPYNYYPCPSLAPMDTTNTPAELIYFQKAIKKLDSCEFYSAMKLLEKAIEINPKNPSTYYYYSKIILERLCSKIDDDTVKKYMPKAEEYLNRSIELEDKNCNKIKSYSLKYLLYQDYKKDKPTLKETENTLKELHAEYEKEGFFIEGGVNYLRKEAGIEFGFAYGYRGYGNLWNCTYLLGVNYEKQLNTNIDGFRLIGYALQNPIKVAIYPTLYTDYKNYSFGIRPEIGFCYKWFNISYGYNFLTKTSAFNMRGHIFTLKANLCLARKKVFQNE